MNKIFLIFVFCQVLYAAVEKPIVVIIPSYNNERYVKSNLNSVFDQEYTNYRVIYIDDCSTDKTLSRVQEVVKRRVQEHRTTIIHNDHNCGALYNLYVAIHACDDDDIIVTLDGDDWLAHSRVFQSLHKKYQNNGAWLTYGRYSSYPQGKLDDQGVISAWIKSNNAYREDRWKTSHLRTFYAGLFKQIALQDLIYDGRFFSVTWDMAFMFPMLEIAGEHAQFLDEVVYIYNCENPLNDYKKKLLYQLHCEKVIRAKEKYALLQDFHRKKQVKCAVCVIAENQDRLADVINSCESHVKNVDEKIIVYEKKAEQELSLQEMYPSWHCHDATGNSREMLLSLLAALDAEYILVADTKAVCTHDIMVHDDALFLRATGAQGVYYCYGKESKDTFFRDQKIIHIPVGQDFNAWFFAQESGIWREAWDTTLTLFEKNKLVQALSSVSCSSIKDVLTALHTYAYSAQAVGLMHNEARGYSYEK